MGITTTISETSENNFIVNPVKSNWGYEDKMKTYEANEYFEI